MGCGAIPPRPAPPRRVSARRERPHTVIHDQRSTKNFLPFPVLSRLIRYHVIQS